MSNIFEKIIDKHVAAFKESINNDIRAFLSGETVKAPKAAKKTVTPKTPKAPKADRKPRGANVDVTTAVRDIVAKVASHPEGVKGGIVRAELKLEKAVWNKAIKAAVAQKSLTTKGSKRGMTYHYKAPKVKAGKPETVAEAAE
jgi:pyruvate/2-oxoglutarate dehydrogenase complex dihydrolipoamide acyltransferase (E2) component